MRGQEAADLAIRDPEAAADLGGRGPEAAADLAIRGPEAAADLAIAPRWRRIWRFAAGRWRQFGSAGPSAERVQQVAAGARMAAHSGNGFRRRDA
jgi:muconolactone delta-isomerase